MAKKSKKGALPKGPPTVSNRRAMQSYVVEDRFEAGMVLTGSEVKSLRGGGASLDGSYAGVKDGEIWLYGMHIAPYAQATSFQHEPRRERKLMLHSREIEKIIGRVNQKGYTLVPVRVYFKKGWVKVEIGLARGKQHEDRRQDLRKKADQRDTRVAITKGKYS